MGDTLNKSAVYSWSREHLLHVLSNPAKPIITFENYIKAFKEIDRADFVPDKFKEVAYNDQDIPLGFGQKLDKPTIVAKQISLLAPRVGGKYLEIGAGSGYTSAIIGKIVSPNGKVIATDRILDIVEMCRENLSKYPELGKVVYPLFKDTIEGLPSEAPFDGIISSVAFESLPKKILTQLKIGGIAVLADQKFNLLVIVRESAENYDQKIFPGYVLDPAVSGVE